MREIPVCTNKHIVLGLPKTPARWDGNPVFTPITRILMSCGGGMGGSRWYEYVKRVPHSDMNGLKTVTDVDGKEKTINAAYVVAMEDFSLVNCFYISNNPNFKKGMWVFSMLVDYGTTVLYSNSFNSDKIEGVDVCVDED